MEELRSAMNEAISAVSETDRRNKTQDEMDSPEHVFLKDIAEHPLSTVTERYKRLGLNARKENKIKWMLLEKGLIEQEKVRAPNGSVTLLKLTEGGRDVLAFQGISTRPLQKNASLEHEYYKELAARKYMEQGYEVLKEVPIGDGKAVDLVVTKDGKRIAIEVETGKSNTRENLSKIGHANFDRIVLVATSPAASEACRRAVAGAAGRPPVQLLSWLDVS